MKESEFLDGWDEKRVKRVQAHYEEQSEEEAVAEDETAYWENHLGEITKTDLEEAQKAILSVIRKCEKAQETLTKKQPQPTPQLTLLSRRIKAFRLALSLIMSELESHNE